MAAFTFHPLILTHSLREGIAQHLTANGLAPPMLVADTANRPPAPRSLFPPHNRAQFCSEQKWARLPGWPTGVLAKELQMTKQRPVSRQSPLRRKPFALQPRMWVCCLAMWQAACCHRTKATARDSSAGRPGGVLTILLTSRPRLGLWLSNFFCLIEYSAICLNGSIWCFSSLQPDTFTTDTMVSVFCWR